jgi:predicted AAA+ superfamily ATPase
MNNVGNPVSTYKISNTLKISSESTSRYIQLLEDTYLIYLVPRHGTANLQISSPRKVYAADIGIRNLFTGFINKGRVFENYVYLKIKDFEPYYVLDNKLELDFYISDRMLVEVKFGEDLREKQKEMFDRFDAPCKMVVKDFRDLTQLEALLNG